MCCSDKVEVFVEICRKDAILPSYARHGDAGMDICAAEDVTINPGETVIIPTGLKLAIPEGYEIQVRPRSGISYKTPLRLSNSPGTIDSGYRDELGIIMTNTSETGTNTSETGTNSEVRIFTLNSPDKGFGAYKIAKGDRIAQIILQRLPQMVLTVVDSVRNIGSDRGGGFGSTGL